jgi:hypothetical protein
MMQGEGCITPLTSRSRQTGGAHRCSRETLKLTKAEYLMSRVTADACVVKFRGFMFLGDRPTFDDLSGTYDIVSSLAFVAPVSQEVGCG